MMLEKVYLIDQYYIIDLVLQSTICFFVDKKQTYQGLEYVLYKNASCSDHGFFHVFLEEHA